jgi:hypothetical protein
LQADSMFDAQDMQQIGAPETALCSVMHARAMFCSAASSANHHRGLHIAAATFSRRAPGRRMSQMNSPLGLGSRSDAACGAVPRPHAKVLNRAPNGYHTLIHVITSLFHGHAPYRGTARPGCRTVRGLKVVLQPHSRRRGTPVSGVPYRGWPTSSAHGTGSVLRTAARGHNSQGTGTSRLTNTGSLLSRPTAGPARVARGPAVLRYVGRVCYTRGYFQGRSSPHSPLVGLFKTLHLQ